MPLIGVFLVGIAQPRHVVVVDVNERSHEVEMHCSLCHPA
jgi:hypothetical protein